MNMATLFGFSQQQAQDAISRNVEAALQHAATRKAYKGVLTIQVSCSSLHSLSLPGMCPRE